MQQADALRGSARFADLVCVDADDFAVLADDHALGVFVHLHDCRDLSVALRGLDVNHALATACDQAVFLGVSAFAITVLRHRQNEGRRWFIFVLTIGLLLAIGFLRGRRIWDRHTYYVVLVVQIHASDAICRTAHRSNISFFEADGHAIVRGQEDNPVAVSDASGYELVILFDADRDNATEHHVGKT